MTRKALPPSTLALAVPHVRRLRPPGEGGLLRLLRGGRLVFPDARVLPPKVGKVGWLGLAVSNEGEEERASCFGSVCFFALPVAVLTYSAAFYDTQ